MKMGRSHNKSSGLNSRMLFCCCCCRLCEDQTPEITQLGEEGLCDVRRGGCPALQVHGRGFQDSYQLKCEFVKEKVR